MPYAVKDVWGVEVHFDVDAVADIHTAVSGELADTIECVGFDAALEEDREEVVEVKKGSCKGGPNPSNPEAVSVEMKVPATIHSYARLPSDRFELPAGQNYF
eukprot:6255196-Amphidinium_carterae.1